MNTKSIVQLTIVFLLAIAAGHYCEKIPRFISKTEHEVIDISIIQHRIRNISIYEPIRERDISIIEYWERESSWLSSDVVLMFAWRSEPSYQVSFENIEINPSVDDSSIAGVTYGDNAFTFNGNMSGSYETIQRIDGSLDANREEEIIQQTYGLLNDFIEFKYSETNLRNDAQEMTDVLLKTLIETIMVNQFKVEVSGREV